MKAVIKFIRIFISAVLTIPFFVTAVVGIILYWFFTALRLKKTADAVSHFFYYILCCWIMFFIGGRVHIEGRENIPPRGEAVVYAPNHNSLIDVPFFYMALRRFPAMMAKKELFKVPVMHGCLVSLKCIKIDRKGAHSIVEAVRSGCRTIEDGHSIVIFPEGTRSKTGEIGAFKNGAFKIAERTGCPVVPVVIKNDRYLLEGACSFGFVDVYIKFLPAVETKNLDEEGRKNLTGEIENRIREEWKTLPDYKYGVAGK